MTRLDRSTAERVAAAQPEWRARQMADAFEAFEVQEAPSAADESWRYVDLDVDLGHVEPALEAGERLSPGPFLSALEERAGQVTIIDGVVVEAAAGDGVLARRIDQLDEGGFVPAAGVDHNKLAAAHVAFATDGAVIEVPPRTAVGAPIVVDVQATRAGTISFPHLRVAVGRDAEASVLVVYRSPDGVDVTTVPGITLDVADGGRLRFQSVQGLGDMARGIVHQRLMLGRDSVGRLGEVGLGGALGRLDLDVTLDGAGSSVEVVGLYFGERAQTLDYRLTISHRGRNTSSNVFLKGAVEDRAQSVFTGLLRIEKDAVRSSAFETNRNLVLSEEAKAHSVPNLEILCNDVICGHGSSVGPLEADHLYYLMSRGLPRARAERMLIRGFFTEVLDRLPIPAITRPVEQAVFARFVEAQEAGRTS